MGMVPSDVIASQTVGMESWNNNLAAMRKIAYTTFLMGGSLDDPHPGTAYQGVVHRIPFVLPTIVGSGGTWVVECFLKCQNVATTITPRIYNLSTATAVSTGTACSGTADDFSGTGQIQYLTFTPTLNQLYELWASKSATSHLCWIVGRARRSD